MRKDPLAGETEAGSAGTQPARDSRPGLRRMVAERGGALTPSFSPIDRSKLLPMPCKIQTAPGSNRPKRFGNKLNFLSQKAGTLHPDVSPVQVKRVHQGWGWLSSDFWERAGGSSEHSERTVHD